MEADNTLSFEIPLQERRVSLVWKPAKGVGDEKAECNLFNKVLSLNDSNTCNIFHHIIFQHSQCQAAKELSTD